MCRMLNIFLSISRFVAKSCLKKYQDLVKNNDINILLLHKEEYYRSTIKELNILSENGLSRPNLKTRSLLLFLSVCRICFLANVFLFETFLSARNSLQNEIKFFLNKRSLNICFNYTWCSF